MRFGPHIRLLAEVVIVSTVVLAFVSLPECAKGPKTWLMAPWALTLGALLPTVVMGRSVRGLGVCWGRAREGLPLLCAGVAAVFLLGIFGRAVLGCLFMEPPLVVRVPESQWVSWLVFQIAYVAVPEELFFRGYFLSNSRRLLGTFLKARPSTAQYGAMVLSAGVFALSHMLALGGIASFLIFFPGLIFSWFLIRMRTIVAPVLLHAAANAGYALMVKEAV
jgi:membrane protease YdiL (CAAX protease family)